MILAVRTDMTSKMLEKCVDAIPVIAGLAGCRLKIPAKVHANKGYGKKAL